MTPDPAPAGAPAAPPLTAPPLTTRAGRSLGGRLAPVAVLVLGLASVVAAGAVLAGIYDTDPGVVRSWQVAPRAVAGAHAALPVLGDLRRSLAGTSFAQGVCDRPLLADLCHTSPARPDLDDARLAAQDRAARRLVAAGGTTTDVTLDHWQEAHDGIVVVAVARYPHARRPAGEAGEEAQTVTGQTVAGTPATSKTWWAGSHVMVAVVASASDGAAAGTLADRTGHQVAAAVGLARVTWFELVALAPLLLLFAFLASVRFVLILAVAVAFIPVGIGVIVVLGLALVVLLLRRVFTRRRAGTAAGPPRPAGAPDGPEVRHSGVAAPGMFLGTDEGGRQAFPAVLALVGFGIAILTTSLFPGSLVWGSLVLAAMCAPPAWAGKIRRLAAARKAMRWVVALVVAGVLTGFGPHRLLDNVGLQALAVAVGVAVLVGQWRSLTAGTAVDYAPRWYEDVDARSTSFLVGAAVLTTGAGALFLASSGNTDLAGQLSQKAVAAMGLAVAGAASAHVRASRDAARRDRARERRTPPVLYLRSFGDDGLRVKSYRVQRTGLERLSWRRTELFEDVVAGALGRIGPVVAIAKPGTGQRDLGPARDSIVTDDWLEAVKAYMHEAALVAVVLAGSEGLVTELETLGELGLLDRLCLFVPPVDPDEVARRLDLLGRQVGYAGAWGSLSEDPGGKARCVTLTSIGGERAVITAPRRTALAYRNAVAAMLPGVAFPTPPSGARRGEGPS